MGSPEVCSGGGVGDTEDSGNEQQRPLEVRVPLSDHEQRLLEQMERVLSAEDPKLASTLRGTGGQMRRRWRVIIAGVGFVVGIGLLFASVVVPTIAGHLATQVVVGGLGFLLMLLSAYTVATSLRTPPPTANPPGVTNIDSGRPGHKPRARGTKGSGATGSGTKGRGGSFMARMEERWRRRREGGPN